MSERRRRLKTIAASLAIGAGMCVLVCVLAGLFAAAAGLRSTTPAAAIERVLRADASAAGGADGPGETAANMRAIGLEGCPDDFQDAYLRHVEAWERSASVYAEADDWVEEFAPGRGTAEDALFTTNMPEGVSPEGEARRRAIQLSRANAQDAIESTFEAVQRVAAKHGARVSP
jgi:hypothetical protein